VQHRRFCVSVDESVQTMLLSFGTILDAKRQVTKARRAENNAGPYTARLLPEDQSARIHQKRSFADRDDVSGFDANGDMDMGSDTATENNSGHVKQKPAPFIDRIN
jgi:serine/threonine/tyrosine-interacting protein